MTPGLSPVIWFIFTLICFALVAIAAGFLLHLGWNLWTRIPPWP